MVTSREISNNSSLLFNCSVLSDSFVTQWVVSLPGSSVHGIYQAWSGLPFPSPGYPPNSEIEPVSPTFAGGFFTTEPQGEPQ